MKIAVLGAGSWGTALAIHVGGLGHEVRMWARNPALANELQASRRNAKYLPDVILNEQTVVSSNIAECVEAVDVILFAIPLQVLREFVVENADDLPPAKWIGTAKGIEAASGKFEHDILNESARHFSIENYAALSGPTLAAEIAMGMPTSAVIASKSESTGRELQSAMSSDRLRLYRSADVIGVEFAGAMKNVIALAAGMVDGMGYGANTKGTLITRGLAELARLGEAIGGERKTFVGLAGMGDLTTTCMSPRSRNRQVGEYIGRGDSLEVALKKTGQVAEGVWTARAALEMGRKHNVNVPITEGVCAVLEGKLTVRDAVRGLMERQLKEED